MKNIVFTITMLLFLSLTLNTNTSFAQTHSDPPYLKVVTAEKQITIDGILSETDWQKRYDYLVYGANALPGDVTYTVTGGILVDPGYTDTTITFVRFLHDGLKLYISLQSNDKSICRRTTGWEGDGLFMKIKKADGSTIEFKLFYSSAGVGAPIKFEAPSLNPTWGEGAGYVIPPGVVNHLASDDTGYTAEMVIYLDSLGYTDPQADIPVLINIFDPDGFDDVTTTGSYHKMWWGSEWGDSFRMLRLADPPLKHAIVTTETITLDGQLNEVFWANAESVVVSKPSNTSTGGYYKQWNSPLNSYNDQSRATVKFVHKGTDLYIGVESDDKSVCEWAPGWEADGLLLWMTMKDDYLPDPGQRLEIKNMFFGNVVGDSAHFELSATVPTGGAEGASFEPLGTVSHTEVGGPDDGYSLEVIVHTDLFGYSVLDTVRLSIVIYDIDYASNDAISADTSDFAPNWWGTQWVDKYFEKFHLFRQVVLSNSPTDVKDNHNVFPNSFVLKQNYPNPFNPSTTISYSIPENSSVTLKVFNVLGNEVATLVNEFKNAGEYNMRWQPSNVSSGVYFYELRTDDFIKTNKMILLR